MSLITPQQKINVEFINDSQSLAAHLVAAANIANKQSSLLLSLDNDKLMAWLNDQPQEDLFALFTAHATLGNLLNQALDSIKEIMSQSEITTPQTRVDTRPFAEKLADNERIFSIDEEGKINITDA